LPNVGKSTLANALSKSNASLTADLPGTTRDYVEIEANLAGLIVRLLDTPGQRQTPDPLERAAISLAQPHIDSADLTLLLTDASRPSPPEELALLAAHPTAIHIATRCDLVQTPATTCSPASPERPPSPHLPPRGRSAEGRERVPYGRPLPVSAKTGQGLPTLIAAITAHFGIAPDLDKLHLNF
jgi:tRNA modification GTPase